MSDETTSTEDAGADTIPADEPVDRHIQIGTRHYEIQAFTARKVFRAAKLVHKLDKAQRKADKEVASYRREYRQDNTLEVTRAMSGVEPWHDELKHLTADDWDRIGGHVEVHEEPDDYQLQLVQIGTLIDTAEDEVKRLLAIVVMPNDEFAEKLKGAEDSDKVLDEYAEHFMDVSVAEFVDLAYLTIAVIREELRGKVSKVRRMKGVLKRGLLNFDEPTSDQAQPAGSSGKKSTSSTASPTATDGPTETASTESPTESLQV